MIPATTEEQRLRSSTREEWRKWGPYLAERSWGTARENYSPDDGNAWGAVPHDIARSRAYRWVEDGIAGFSDSHQILNLGIGLWNTQDGIIKERMYGLSNPEGNHGEDVKEYYYYLDATPSHSYNKYLYKYPQKAYPFSDLINENKRRLQIDYNNRQLPEYELIDTGIFDQDKYFDVFVEYAKGDDPEDIFSKITVFNRGPESAPLHILPHLWYRNTWSPEGKTPPNLQAFGAPQGSVAATANGSTLGARYYYVDQPSAALLFTNNETNTQRLYGSANPSPYVKDGINNYVVYNDSNAVNNTQGTKLAVQIIAQIPAGGKYEVRIRLSSQQQSAPFQNFDNLIATRLQEANDFFEKAVHAPDQTADQKLVQRQAIAGLLWSKQFYNFNVARWRSGDPAYPQLPQSHGKLNPDWDNFDAHDVISMPDKWEYPYFCSWELDFVAVALSGVDPAYARSQLLIMLKEGYLHPRGIPPASEWNFTLQFPPIHSWAVLKVYESAVEKGESAGPDGENFAFLESTFQKLLLTFTWWVNALDSYGVNVFSGGFLGLDNISVLDRPNDGSILQADGSAWMASDCLTMLKIALTLAQFRPAYESIAIKFLEHFILLARAIDQFLWSEDDAFYFDVMTFDRNLNNRMFIKIRSFVGLLPLAAVEEIPVSFYSKLPAFQSALASFQQKYGKTFNSYVDYQGNQSPILLSVVGKDKLRTILTNDVLDENKFLSSFGVRSVSKDPANKFNWNGSEIKYAPSDSTNGLFGGNSNFRGPIWFCLNFFFLDALHKYGQFYKDDFTIAFPSGGKSSDLTQVANLISQRLSSLFLKKEDKTRPVFGGSEKLNSQFWVDHLFFSECFHGDTGKGLGALRQTGWTGLVGRLLSGHT